MSRVKNKNTELEIKFRKALWADGLRYKLKSKLQGKPDLVFVGAKVAVFIDGCFWHGCPEHGQTPATNTEFWQDKIHKNMKRDLQVNEALTQEGWKVIRVWQHDIKQDLQACITKIKSAVSRPSRKMEINPNGSSLEAE